MTQEGTFYLLQMKRFPDDSRKEFHYSLTCIVSLCDWLKESRAILPANEKEIKKKSSKCAITFSRPLSGRLKPCTEWLVLVCRVVSSY